MDFGQLVQAGIQFLEHSIEIRYDVSNPIMLYVFV